MPKREVLEVKNSSRKHPTPRRKRKRLVYHGARSRDVELNSSYNLSEIQLALRSIQGRTSKELEKKYESFSLALKD